MSGWLLRPATRADADVIVAIEAAAFGPASWGGRAAADGLSERFVATTIAQDDDGVDVGYLMWRRLGDEAEILSIGVAPPHQRKGCARVLLAALLETARRDGVRALFLEVDAGNQAAIALYEEQGFSRIARRRRYYRSGADALVMRVDL